jgi:protein-S-isoprenylcysteine O-methyltransferase Ste14
MIELKTESEASPDVPRVMVFPPLLFVSAIALGTVLQVLWPIHLRAALSVRMAGVIPVVMGITFIISAKRGMRRLGTNVRPDRPTTAIVNDGPYRFTRNPIYLGGSLVYLGVALLLNVFWPLPAFVPFLILLDWGVVKREELYLERKFGDVYLNYKQSVRRWI